MDYVWLLIRRESAWAHHDARQLACVTLNRELVGQKDLSADEESRW